MLDLTIKAIDIHSHYNHGSAFDTKTSLLYKVDTDSLKKERLKMGVKNMACCSFASVLSDKDIIEENTHCYKLCEKDGFFYQWVVIDPRKKDTLKQAEEMLKSPKVLGLKIHSVFHGYSFTDYADEVFAFANQLKTTVMMHPDEPEKTALIADKYPDARLIIAHLGSMEHIRAVLSANHGNVYVDTSGNASSQNNVIEHAVSVLGAEKILFGTDTYSSAFQKGRILLADISDKDKKKILYENAERLFDLN